MSETKPNSHTLNTGAMIKQVQQRNHGESVIPDEIQQWADQPLYMLIAIWCHLQKRWINRQEIANVFQIDKRRASFLISYILNKKEKITCQTRSTPRSAPWFCQQEVFIQHVEVIENKPKRRENNGARGPRRGRVGNARSADWHWLLTRKPPGTY